MNLADMMMGAPMQGTPMTTSMFGNMPYLNLPTPQPPQAAPQAPQAAPMAPADPQAQGQLGWGAPQGEFYNDHPWHPQGYINPNTNQMYRRAPGMNGETMLMPANQWRDQYGK